MINDNNDYITFHITFHLVICLLNHYPHIGHLYYFPYFWFEKHCKNISMETVFHIVQRFPEVELLQRDEHFYVFHILSTRAFHCFAISSILLKA